MRCQPLRQLQDDEWLHHSQRYHPLQPIELVVPHGRSRHERRLLAISHYSRRGLRGCIIFCLLRLAGLREREGDDQRVRARSCGRGRRLTLSASSSSLSDSTSAAFLLPAALADVVPVAAFFGFDGEFDGPSAAFASPRRVWALSVAGSAAAPASAFASLLAVRTAARDSALSLSWR